MKKLKNASKGAVAVMLCVSIISVHSAAAFVWPVTDAPQLGAFGVAIQDGLTQYNTFKSQIDEHVKTIHTVGDKITAYAKYAEYAKPFIKFLPEDVRKHAEMLVNLNNLAVKEISAKLNLMDNIYNGSTQITNDAVNGVDKIIHTDYDKFEDEEKAEDRIDNIIEGANKAVQNEISQMLALAKQETLKAFNDSFDSIVLENTQNVLNYTAFADSYLMELTDYVKNNEHLNDEETLSYLQRIEETQRKIDHLQDNSKRIEEEAKAEFERAVSAAYEEFDEMLQKFYRNEISKEELAKASEKLKDDVKKAGERITENTIKNLNNIKDELQEIQNDIASLKNDIMNSSANSRDYPDESDVKNTTISSESQSNSGAQLQTSGEKTSFLREGDKYKAMFTFQSQKEYAYAKSVYKKDNSGGEYFIMPDELKNCKAGSKIDIKKLADSDTIGKFRKNVVCTKMEKTFWCPSDPENPKCRPYAKAGWAEYEKNGTYKHMQEDYLIESNVLHNKVKQYAISWGDLSDKNSTVNKLDNLLKTATDDTRKAYGALGEINLETTKLWSWIRRNDALDRASSIIDSFSQEKTLYLGVKNDSAGTEDIVQKALDKYSGVVEVKVGDKNDKKSVFSDVFLYVCGLNRGDNYDGTKAENISVAYENKYNDEEIKKAEEKIAKCLLKFSEAANRGTIDGCSIIKGNKEAGAKIWRNYQKMIMHDTAFRTLYMAALSSYKSVEDLTTGKGTIIALQKGLKKATVARDDYAANAEINNYATGQILDIIDAEAQSIQTEILQDLPKLNYNVFGEVVEVKEDSQCGGN